MNTVIAKEQDTSSTPPKYRLFESSSKKRQLLALLLFVLTLLVYNPVSRFQFVNYDDPKYVIGNSHVQEGLHWHTLGWALTTFDFYNWHPLTWITFLTDYQFFALNPAGYHMMNVIYHAFDAVLLFLVLHRSTGHLGRSFCVAVLFALHPLNVQSVAWISERKNVVSAIFWFLAIWAYGWYALRPGWKRYLAVAICFALGLMAKAMVITLPCVLLLLDIWPLGRVKNFPYAPEAVEAGFNTLRKGWTALVLEKIPLLILSAASAVLTILAQKQGGAIRSTTVYPIGVRIENAILSYALYLEKAFLPRKLAVFYPHPGFNIPGWEIAASALLLIGITFIVIRLRGKRPYLLVGWLSFLVTLAPVIGLLQNGDQAMADRYAYTPLIGVFLMLVWEVASWLEQNRARRLVAAALSALLFGALIADTRHQLGYWHDSISLFSHAVSVTQNNSIAEANLGEALYTAGKVDEAALHFFNAVRYDSKAPGNHYNYGHSLLVAKKPQEAIAQFNQVLQPGSQRVDNSLVIRSHYELGLAYIQIGNLQVAEDELKKALAMDPSQYDALLQLGLLYQKQNRCQEAIPPLAYSLHMVKSNVGLVGLGTCLEQQGKLREARAAFLLAVQIFSGYEPAQTKLREVDGLLAGKKEPKNKVQDQQSESRLVRVQSKGHE
ncbi:MAG TPA: tetratricopeptide repeat protein [Terriglobales bacterium]|nr:tetratricopeptide repeat protein [Terriglobales bacterium]